MKFLYNIFAILITFLIVVSCTQKPAATRSVSNLDVKGIAQRFPGLNSEQIKKILWAKEQYCIPFYLDSAEARKIERETGGKCMIVLPTWLPDGFLCTRIIAKLGRGINPDSMQMRIVYEKEMPHDKRQIFSIEAGFDGLGSYPYDSSIKIRCGVGDVYLYYQPTGDDGKEINQAVTEWFGCNAVQYPVYGYQSSDELFQIESKGPRYSFEMINLDETKKIIASLQKF